MTGPLREPRPYRVLLTLAEPNNVDPWINLAAELAGESGEIVVRGLVVVPDDQSLSEGTNAAQQLRDVIEQALHKQLQPHGPTEIRVDYQPLARVLDEIPQLPVDLLLVQWQGPVDQTGGLSTEDVLRFASCDLVLVCGEPRPETGSALLSLRGGPNLTLGLRVAKALAQGGELTL